MGERTADATVVRDDMTAFRATVATLNTNHGATIGPPFPTGILAQVDIIEANANLILDIEDDVFSDPGANYTGQHDGNEGSAFLRDSSAPFPNNDGLKSFYVVNRTTGAHFWVTSNNRRRVNLTIAVDRSGNPRNGTRFIPSTEPGADPDEGTEIEDNTWNVGDRYRVNVRENRHRRRIRRASAGLIKPLNKIARRRDGLLAEIVNEFGYEPGEFGRVVVDQQLIDDFTAARQSLSTTREAARRVRNVGR